MKGVAREASSLILVVALLVGGMVMTGCGFVGLVRLEVEVRDENTQERISGAIVTIGGRSRPTVGERFNTRSSLWHKS